MNRLAYKAIEIFNSQAKVDFERTTFIYIEVIQQLMTAEGPDNSFDTIRGTQLTVKCNGFETGKQAPAELDL